MNKLINKIKLILAQYINRREDESDNYLNGKIALAKEISDAIDFVNKKNLEVDGFENGDIVYKETINAIPAARGFADGNYYLRLNAPSADMHLFDVPFIPDPEEENDMQGGSYEVIVRKVENKKKPGRKNAKVAEEEPKPKVRRKANNVQWNYAQWVNEVQRHMEMQHPNI